MRIAVEDMCPHPSFTFMLLGFFALKHVGTINDKLRSSQC